MRGTSPPPLLERFVSGIGNLATPYGERVSSLNPQRDEALISLRTLWEWRVFDREKQEALMDCRPQGRSRCFPFRFYSRATL